LKIDENLGLQKKSRIRILSRKLTSTEAKNLESKIQLLYEPHEIVFKDDVNAHRQEVKIDSETTIEDLSDTVVQDKLIKEFLSNYNVKEEKLKKVFELNRHYDAYARRQEDSLRNLQYKLGKMGWSNIGSYGEDNVFDFSRYKGTVGIFGKSAAGKSTLAVDVPLYTILNTNSKGVVKNDSLINENKETCSSFIDIHIAKDTYRIERETTTYVKTGKRRGKPIIQGKTDVSFFIYDEFGELKEDLNGLERGDTDKEIRRIFGSADDFMATSVAPQWRLLDFIKKKSTDRQKIIGKYFDVDIFEKKKILANERFKELKGELKLFANKNFSISKKILTEDLKRRKEELETVKAKISECEEEIKEIDKQIESLTRSYIPDISLKYDKEYYDTQIKSEKEDFLKKKEELKESLKKIEDYKKRILTLESDSLKFDIGKLEKDRNDLSAKLKIVSNKNKKIGSYDGFLEEVDDKIKDLKKYRCVVNPDCCMLEEVNSLEDKKKIISEKRDILSESINKESKTLGDKISLIDGDIKRCNNILNEISNLKKSVNEYEKLSKINKQLLKSNLKNIEDLESNRKRYLNNIEKASKNKEILENISSFKERREECKKVIDSFNILKKVSDISSVKKELDILKKEEKEFSEIKKEYESYDFFIRAMSRDGIVKNIIANNLDIINREIENILFDAGFTITLESEQDGKSIEIYYSQEKSKKRSIDLLSGMEKTMAALAIRAAMISVTTLPKPGVFILDEVFSALDSEWLESAIKILNNLKKYFDVIIIITHNDYLKDAVDYVVEIERDENGYSKLL